VVLKVGHLGKWRGNKLKVIKYGAGEVWKKSVGPIELEIKENSRRSRITYVQ
jgi:hypothetical protein